MKNQYIYINWFSNIDYVDIKQHIHDTTEQPQEISLLFPKVTEDIFHPENVTEQEREEIKKETDLLRTNQETILNYAEKQYISSLDHNDWKEINQHLVEQNGEYPPLRIKKLFEIAVALKKETKIYIKASDVGLHSVDHYGDVGSFWIGNPLAPTDVQKGDTIIEFTIPAGMKTLILPDGTHVLDQSAFEINKYGYYYINGRTETFAVGKLVDRKKMYDKLKNQQSTHELKLAYGYKEKNPTYASEVPKEIFSLEEVTGPYASFFLEKFFADPIVKKNIEGITEGIPTEVMHPLMNILDTNNKGLIRFTTKEIPYGIDPAKRIAPYAKYVATDKYIEVTLPDPNKNLLTPEVLDYMTHDVKKAFAEAMDDQFFRYLTNTAREVGQVPAKLADMPNTKEFLSTANYSNFYEFIADLWSNDPEKRDKLADTDMGQFVLINIQSIQKLIQDSNSKDPSVVDGFLKDWASRGDIITAPFVPDTVKQYFFHSFLPRLFEDLQQELKNNNWNLEGLSAYNGRLYKTYQNSERLVPYLKQPVISEIDELQQKVEKILDDIKDTYVSALNFKTKMFDLSQILDKQLLHDNNFVDSLALIMNKIPGEILDTLLNRMDTMQNGLIQPVPILPDNTNGVITDPSILTIQLVIPNSLTTENLNKMTHEGKKQIGYMLDTTLFRNAYKFIYPLETLPDTFSTSEALIKVIQEEKNSFIPRYSNIPAKTNQEFFAEVFASFLAEDNQESSRAEHFAKQTVSVIRGMMESYSNSIQNIRDINRTKAIVQTLPPIETYTANIIEKKDLPSTLESIRHKVLEAEALLPVEKAVYRVIEVLQSDAATILPVPLIVYGPNSIEELQADLTQNLTPTEMQDPTINIDPDRIRNTQPILDSKNFAYTIEPNSPSDTAVYCTGPATTIQIPTGRAVIPISDFSKFQTPSQFVNEKMNIIINHQQSDIQLEKATLQINKNFIREFHLTGKLIEVDKKIVFSHDKVSKVTTILKAIMKIEAFTKIIIRISQKLNPIYGDIYVIVPKSQETLIPSNAAYKGDWDQEKNRIVLELPSGKEKKETPKQVSGLLYAFSKKAYTIAKESGGAAGIATSQFDTIVANNLSFDSLRESILKSIDIDIINDPRFNATDTSIITKNLNYFGALGSLYYTNPDFLKNTYPDLFIQISSVFNNLP